LIPLSNRIKGGKISKTYCLNSAPFSWLLKKSGIGMILSHRHIIDMAGIKAMNIGNPFINNGHSDSIAVKQALSRLGKKYPVDK
jgi:hypothetical protein